MRTIIAKAPAYGMPTLAGAVNKPEKVNAIPPGPPPGEFGQAPACCFPRTAATK